MKEQAAKVIEEKLKRLSYREIAEKLSGAKPQTLVQLLDSKSIKIGDTAADFLGRKRLHSLIIIAILEKKITSKL